MNYGAMCIFVAATLRAQASVEMAVVVSVDCALLPVCLDRETVLCVVM